MPTVVRNPGLEILESAFAKRIKALLTFRPDLHDPRFRQDAKVPRDAGLVNIHPVHNIADRNFAILHHLDDAKAGRIGQGLKHTKLRNHAYTYTCIFNPVKRRYLEAPTAL
ncbi:MAG TPA: hypothetical protein VHV26_13870 [Rhizomicrobium sp.]|nr:hypothetical protein [Rhizomicrobium sp.]